MGGEGTIQSMITSLKNNKKLLIRRKTFFDRKHSRRELKRIYSEKIKPNNKELAEDEKRRIREALRAELKRENRLKLAIVLGCLIIIPLVAYFAFSGMQLHSERSEGEINMAREQLNYDESIRSGLLSLKNNKPFFAIGHFENALAIQTNDSLAIEKLIISYQLLCEQNEKTCEWVHAKIDSLNNAIK